MDTLEKLELDCLGIVVVYSKTDKSISETISSTMKEPNNPENKEFNRAVNALESLILSHYRAGINITCHEYLRGIQIAYDVIVDNEPSFYRTIDTLFKALKHAEIVSIDALDVRYFTLNKFDKEAEDPGSAICLEAESFQFTFDEIKNAKKKGRMWLVQNNGEEYQLICDRVIAI